MRVAIALFPRNTALDAIGPYEVLQRVPSIDVVFVGERRGEVRTDNGMLGLMCDATFDEVTDPGNVGSLLRTAAAAGASVVLPDLRRDASTRTNLVIVNGHGFGGLHLFRLEVHDGDTGDLAAAREITLERGARIQLDDVLRDLVPSVARAWARIVPSFPTDFSAYAVVMDGAAPGERTDDGAFVAGVPEESPPR